MNNLINIQQLTFTAKNKLGYHLHIAEKDYFLALALQTIYNSDLKDRLIFKGGTALHHIYLPQYRFSEDLDFVSTDQNITIEDVRGIFANSLYFTVKKDYVSEITVKIEKLQYVGILAQPNFIKIDISNVKNLAMPSINKKYINAWGIDVDTKVMDKVEICAEKISATSGRIRYRDFYDLYLIVNELGVNIKEALNLLKLKDREKLISKDSIMRNWISAQKEKQKDIDGIQIKKIISDNQIETLLKNIKFVNIPPNHKNYKIGL